MQTKSVIYLCGNPVVTGDGATISMIERLRLLRDLHGWKVAMVCCGREEHREGLLQAIDRFGFSPRQTGTEIHYEIEEIPVCLTLGPGLDRFETANLLAVKSSLEKVLSRISASIIFANMRDLPATALAIERSHFIFLTEDEYARPIDPIGVAGDLNFGVIYPRVKSVIVASEFLQKSIAESWQIASTVLSTPIDIDKFSAGFGGHEKHFVSTLHPSAHKGIEIVLALAEALPKRKFLVIGSLSKEYREIKKQLARFKNISEFPFQSDVRKVYSESRIVLVPSLWKEAFSRVIVESAACGIPTIASRIGGIPEAAEDSSLLVDVSSIVARSPGSAPNISEWITAIKSLDDPVSYAQAQERAMARAQRYKEKVFKDLSDLNSRMCDLLN